MTSPTCPGPGPSGPSGRCPPSDLQRLEDGVDDGRVLHRQAEDVDGAGADGVAQARRPPPVEDEDQAGIGQAQAQPAQGHQACGGGQARSGDEDVDRRVLYQDLVEGGQAGTQDQLGPGPETGDGPPDLAAEVVGLVENEDRGDTHGGLDTLCTSARPAPGVTTGGSPLATRSKYSLLNSWRKMSRSASNGVTASR